jgi:N-acetylglucosamine kinase-like BadF-type ATPase
VLDEAIAQGLISADQAQFMKDRIQARLDAGWVMGMGTGTGCTMQDGTRSPRMGGMGMSRGSQGGMMGGGNR